MDLTLRSSITSELMRSVLFRGTFFAAIGVGVLIYAATFLPFEHLSRWGWLIFICCGGCIALGLVPYRRLCRLERQPHRIQCDDTELLFYRQGKLVLRIPIVSIKKLGYFEKKGDYGIQVWLKDPIPEKVIVTDSSMDAARFAKQSRTQYGCDFFLPYFTKKSLERLLR